MEFNYVAREYIYTNIFYRIHFVGHIKNIIARKIWAQFIFQTKPTEIW